MRFHRRYLPVETGCTSKCDCRSPSLPSLVSVRRSPTLFDLQAAYMAGKLTISPSGWSPQPVFSWLAIDGLHLAVQSDGIMRETTSAPAMAVAADWAPPSRNKSIQSVAGFTSGWIVFRARSD